MSLNDLTPDQKFHSFALLRCRDHKAIDNQLMLKHFGVRTLIESIAKSSNERRADILQMCTGIKPKSALRMGISESASMIQTALDEGDTNADEIFDEKGAGISTEEIVRFFPLDRVFDLWFNSGFITTETDDDKAFMADLYHFVITHKLLGEMTALQLVQDLGLKYFVADACPIKVRIALLEKVLAHGEPMLAKARPDASSANAAKAKPFTAHDLFEVVTPTVLVGFIPLGPMSKPIYALATAKGWMKIQAVLPAGALDSEAPPPPDASSGQAKSDDDILAELEAEEKAKKEREANGSKEPADEEEVVVVDGDDDEVAPAAASDGKSGLTVPLPPPLKKDKDKKSARAGS